MGSESSPRKHSYDISKSKRTRRATLYLTTVEEDEHGADQNNENNQTQIGEEEQKNDHVKLKQLIKVEEKADVNVTSDESRPVLGQYFADEKQLQLVVKQPEDGPQGAKLKKVLKRYVKALGHMVKSKRNQRLDKPALRLPM